MTKTLHDISQKITQEVLDPESDFSRRADHLIATDRELGEATAILNSQVLALMEVLPTEENIKCVGQAMRGTALFLDHLRGNE